jgi:hypothetical protein
MRMHIHQAGHHVRATQVDLLDARRGGAPDRFLGAAVLDAAAAYPDTGRLGGAVGDAVDDGAVVYERVGVSHQAPASVEPDSGVDHGVEQVHDDVCHHHPGGGDDDDADDHRKVLLLNGVHGDPAQPGQAEDLLGDHRAAE